MDNDQQYLARRNVQISPIPDKDNLIISTEEIDASGSENEVVRFRWNQFLGQLFPQFLYPVSIPFVACFTSYYAARNLMGVVPTSWKVLPIYLIFFFSSLAPLITLGAEIYSPTHSYEAIDGTLRADIVHVLAAYISLRLGVCIKYAYMLPATYSERTQKIPPESERRDEQLISGWYSLTSNTISREVAIAVTKQAEASKAFFGIKRQALLRLFAVFDCEESKKIIETSLGIDGSTEIVDLSVTSSDEQQLFIPVSIFVEALQVSAQKQSLGMSSFSRKFLYLVSALGTFASTIVRFSFGVPVLGETLIEHIIIIGHWISNLVYMGITFQFIAIGAIDHSRRRLALKMLGKAFTPGVKNGESTPPALVFDTHHQTRAFLAARGVLHFFGCAFHERLVLVTSVQIVVFSLFAAYSIISLFLAPEHAIGEIISAFIVLQVLVMPAFLCCGAGLWYAALANDEAVRHVSVIVNARLNMVLTQRFSDNVSDVDHESTSRTLELLREVERTLKRQSETSPISILGIPATWSLFQKFGGVLLSLETLGTTLLFSRLGLMNYSK